MGVGGWGCQRPVDYVLDTTLSKHICSLEDATCYCNDTTLRWGGGGGGVGWGCQRPVDYVLDTTLSKHNVLLRMQHATALTLR